MRILLLTLLLASSVSVRAAAIDDEDWTAFGHVLTLVHTMVRLGLQPNSEAAVGDLLAGHDPEVNGAVAGLFAGATAEMPEQYRDRLASIGRDIAAYAAKRPAGVPSASADRALQARKDLTGMGLRYYDEKQFLEAAKRNDALAVELFVAGGGVDLGATTWNGRTALDLARDNGNGRLAELLSRNLPAKR